MNKIDGSSKEGFQRLNEKYNKFKETFKKLNKKYSEKKGIELKIKVKV